MFTIKLKKSVDLETINQILSTQHEWIKVIPNEILLCLNIYLHVDPVIWPAECCMLFTTETESGHDFVFVQFSFSFFKFDCI